MISADMHKDYSDLIATVEGDLKTLQTRMLRDHRPGSTDLRAVRNHVEKALERIRTAKRLMQYV